MDKKVINEKILIFLENGIIEPSENYSKNVRSISKYGDEVDNEGEVVADSKEYTFIHSQTITLKQLYFQLGKLDKTVFEGLLLRYMKPGNSQGFREISFNVLIHIGCYEKALSCLVINLKSYNDKSYLAVLQLLSTILKYEWHIFTNDQINLTYNWVKETIESKNKFGKEMRKWDTLYQDFFNYFVTLFRQLNILRARELKDSILTGINLEINEDARVLKEKVNLFGFPPDLSSTLEKIDEKFVSAKDNFDFKGCIDLIRSFSERLYHSIAILLDSNDGEKLDEKNSEKVNNFFIKYGLISDNQGKVLISLRHFLSNVGSHRLKSAPEDARLSRNMMVEFGLYLLLRLEDIKHE